MHLLERNPQATKVLRELVRYIHRSGLQPGDKLPSQSEIKEQFGFHNTTLDTAMEALVAHSIVSRRKKAGTVLLNGDQPMRGLWTVGLALLSAASSEPFYGQLLHLIQTHMAGAQLSLRQYMLPPRPKTEELQLSRFPHLVEDLTEGALDAVLTLSYLPEADWAHWSGQTPFIHIGSWETAPCGVIIEQGAMVRDAVDLLASRGVRRPAIVSIGHYLFKEPRFWSAFVEATRAHGLYQGAHQHLFDGGGMRAGRAIAERLLALPPGERPDGVIIINDVIATGFTAVLVNQSAYRPAIVVQTNKQAPLAFSLPVLQFQVDVDELARKAVEMVVQRLYLPEKPPLREWIHPRLVGESQFCIGS